MRTKKSSWFETRVRFDKTQEDGQTKKVTEKYVVDAMSFGEAEERITREMSPYISGDFKVKTITPTAYNEIFFSSSPTDDRYYRVVLSFITIDEKSEKEKRTNVTYLVQAASVEGARKNTEEVMGSTMIDYVFKSLTETDILDVFEHAETTVTGLADELGADKVEVEVTDANGKTHRKTVLPSNSH